MKCEVKNICNYPIEIKCVINNLNAKRLVKANSSVKCDSIITSNMKHLQELKKIDINFEEKNFTKSKKIIEKKYIDLNKKQKESGILLISFGYEYQKITPFCIKSIRAFSTLPIVLHVNTPLHLINKEILRFKNVELIYHNLNDDENRILKTDLISYTKFNKTMYIDVDSLVLDKGFLKEFKELDNYDLISPFWQNYSINELNKVIKSDIKFKKFIQSLSENKISKDIKHTLIGGGVCFFNKNELVKNFFNDYKNKYLEYNIPQDMPALNYSYIKYKKNIKTLNKKLYNNTNSKIIQSLHSTLLEDKNMMKVGFSRSRLNPKTNEKSYVKQGSDIFFTKNKICLVYDVEGWAFFNMANYIKKHLNEFYEIDILKHGSKILKNYDLIFLFSYGLKLIGSINNNNFLCGVSSHKKDVNSIELEKYRAILLNDTNIFKKSNHNNKFYIPNGVDTKVFEGSVKKIEKNKSINIGAVGSKLYSEWKGKQRIEEVCSVLIKKGYNIKNKSLYIDTQKEKLSQKEMIEYYKDIDIFIVSSLSETGPNPLLESMSMGIPTISNEVGLASKLIKNNETGFLLKKHDDIHGYVNSAIKLIENSNLYYNISKNSINKIKEYDWGIISLKYKEMFDSFIKKSKEKITNKGKEKKDLKIFTLNSVKNNIDNLNFIIPNILNQCDFLYLNVINHNLLNKKTKHYNFLNNKKVILTHFKDNDLKSYFSHYEKHGKNVYYFTISDNIKYPYNYAETMINKMKQYDNEYICCNRIYNKSGNILDLKMKNKIDTKDVLPDLTNSCFYTENINMKEIELDKININNQCRFLKNNESFKKKSIYIEKIKFWLKEIK